MSFRPAQILIVDDTPNNIRLLSEILMEEGYLVHKAITGAMALELVKTHPPDLILLDIQMPMMNGYEICARLKANPMTTDIPVIFISALDSVNDRLQAFESGGGDYISKPFYAQEVLARVKNQLTIFLQKQQLQAQNLQLQQEIEQRKQAETALLNLNRELQRLSSLDGLTQLANRRCFDEYLAQEWKRLQREHACLSLIMGDVDYFKSFNDTYGHLAGDTCLKEIAQVLLNTVRRPADMVARYGGEEFAVILPNTPVEGAIAVATLIRQRVEDLALDPQQWDYPFSTGQKGITLSLGVFGLIPTPEQTPEILISCADQALYEAKRQGRNRVVCYTPSG